MASNDLRRRLEVALASGAARDEIISALADERPFGPRLYVDSDSGDDLNDGMSAESPLATFAQVMTNIGDLNTKYKNDGTIIARGYFTEHVSAPINAYGWTIMSGAGGLPHHGTDGGTFLESNGCHWAADAGDAPLLILHEPGWAVFGLMMVPQATYDAIQLNRQETSAMFDASHSIIAHNRFFGPSARAGTAIGDYGGNSHVLVQGNKFESVEFGFESRNVGIAAQNRYEFVGNDFNTCKNDICGNFYGTLVERNRFRTAYNGSTHPNTVNLVYTADAGLAINSNMVIDNWFGDAASDVTIAKGYEPGTGDIWRNWVTDAASSVVTVPA